MKNKIVYLGIDTSNYTTSIGACDENGKVIANIKKLLEVKDGERGLRQSDAVFAHVKNFPLLASELREALGDHQIKSVGVSVRPRDVEGSYMPCFLSGKAVAHSIASVQDLPVYEFSHQAGHIMAALYSSGAMEDLLKGDFIAFHVSGGTTEALYVKPTENGFDVKIVADTEDISAGQAIDRAGVMMGMKFPCGKELELLASTYCGRIHKAKVSYKDSKCNLSGVENIAKKLFDQTHDKALVSAFVLDHISRTLIAITDDIREKYPNIPILYAGGVMSNKILQSHLSVYKNTYFATPEYSSDNAAGIALLVKKISN